MSNPYSPIKLIFIADSDHLDEDPIADLLIYCGSGISVCRQAPFFDIGQPCHCSLCANRAAWTRACGLRPGEYPSPYPFAHGYEPRWEITQPWQDRSNGHDPYNHTGRAVA